MSARKETKKEGKDLPTHKAVVAKPFLRGGRVCWNTAGRAAGPRGRCYFKGSLEDDFGLSLEEGLENGEGRRGWEGGERVGWIVFVRASAGRQDL